MNVKIPLVAQPGVYKEHESLEKPAIPGGNKLRTLSKYFTLILNNNFRWYS